jgi:UDP-N-acetylmuramyl tripeptide synthase
VRASELAARAAGTASRLAGRGGTSLPGKLLLRMEPRAIERLARPLDSAILSATNGKTTTAAMAARVLERGGRTLVHNRAGANMAGGIATALVQGRGDTGLFEVDEFWLGQVLAQVRPRALLLGNLFRDQLDRYGELETIAERWAQALSATPVENLVLNADDPVVADLGREREALYFGVDDEAMAMAQMQHAADAKHCRRCGAAYIYDAIFMGHLGHYHCPNCDARRPDAQVTAHHITLQGVRSARFELRTPAGVADVDLPLPGLYNVYNALAAAALGLALGASLDDIVEGLQGVSPAFGRAETVRLHDRDLSILLVKNPAGANEVLRTLTLEPGEHDVFAVLNDNVADGRDVSWVWDADFEVLADRVRRVTCSGTRAAEMAVRMKYAGVPEDRIVVRESLATGLDAAIGDGEGPLYALPTYTAMLALREELVQRGAAKESFA